MDLYGAMIIITVLFRALSIMCVTGTSLNTEKYTSERTFSCWRPTTPCLYSGTCVNDTAQCLCRAGYLGLQCEIVADAKYVGAGACMENKPCVRGTCLDKGQGAVCLCPPGYYGSHCHLPTLDVECEADRMRVYVRPWGFDGQGWSLPNPVLVGSSSGAQQQGEELPRVETFNSTSSPVTAGLQGFVGEYRHLSGPAGPAIIDLRNESVTTYSRQVSVRYDTLGAHPTDELLVVSCTVPSLSPVVSLPYTVAGEVIGGQWQCGRPSTPCLGADSTCNVVTDVCQCAPGTTGLQCALQQEEVNAGECTTRNPCIQAGSTCFDNGQGALCACLSGYYGDRCQHPPAMVECHVDRMLVSVRPYGYAPDTWPPDKPPVTDDRQACQMQTVAEATPNLPDIQSKGWEGFVRVFYYLNDPCAGNAAILSFNDTTIVYRKNVYVGYDPVTEHYTDQLVNAVCSVPRHVVTTTPTPTTTTSTKTTTASAVPDSDASAATPVTDHQLPTTFSSNLSTPPPTPPSPSPPTLTTTPTTLSTTLSPSSSTHTSSQSAPTTFTTTTTTTTSSESQETTTSGNNNNRQLTSSSSRKPHDRRPEVGRTTMHIGQGQSQSTQSLRPPPPRVKIEVTDETGAAISGKVRLGSVVHVTFSVDPTHNGEDVTDLQVNRCTVFDRNSQMKIDVVKNSCVQWPLGVSLYQKHVGVRILVVKIYTFRHSACLNFNCEVRMCRSSDTSCSKIPDCPLRFRRAVSKDNAGGLRFTRLVNFHISSY